MLSNFGMKKALEKLILISKEHNLSFSNTGTLLCLDLQLGVLRVRVRHGHYQCGMGK
jgi:hypothetical protein